MWVKGLATMVWTLGAHMWSIMGSWYAGRSERFREPKLAQLGGPMSHLLPSGHCFERDGYVNKLKLIQSTYERYNYFKSHLTLTTTPHCLSQEEVSRAYWWCTGKHSRLPGRGVSLQASPIQEPLTRSQGAKRHSQVILRHTWPELPSL